jgi:hypothetical protein
MIKNNHTARYKFRIIDRSNIIVQLQFDPTGFWIGAIWKNSSVIEDFYFQHIMISIIPMIPLHMTILRKVK